MHTTYRTPLTLFLFLYSFTAQAQAQAPIKADWNITGIQQYSNISSLQNDHSLSIDLNLQHPTNTGIWNMHIEANTTPANDSVASRIESSNSDANTAISSKGNGRLQLSELSYQFKALGELNITLGLINSGGFLDTSNIANDENSQFLNSTLVNNPIIDFPDYAIAAVTQYQGDWDWTVLISSTHGIADNPNRDYSELFEVGADDKGLFMALETDIKTLLIGNTQLKIGGWLHSGEHQLLTNSNDTDNNNYGFYTTLSYQHKQHQLELRASVTNHKVSAAHSFISIAHQYDWNNQLYSGLGFSQTNYSKHALVNAENTKILEAYLAYKIAKGMTITPSVQWIENPISEPALTEGSVSIMNLRLNYQF